MKIKNGNYIKIVENPKQEKLNLVSSTISSKEKQEPIKGPNSLSPRDSVVNIEGNGIIDEHDISSSIKGGALVH